LTYLTQTFEIYNICLEELCGQFYLMDLAFHSRVVRKLFHNYKHQLHNIMKYQLTLQKELNLKYQQEKNLKAQLTKLEDDMKTMQKAPEDKKPKGEFNFRDEEEEREKKMAEIRKNHERMKAEANLNEPRQDPDLKSMEEIKAFLSKDFKLEDSSKIREELMKLYSNLEKERNKLKDLDPNSENHGFAMRQAKAELAAMKKAGYAELGTQTEGQWVLDAPKKDNPELLAKIVDHEATILRMTSELENLRRALEDSEQGRAFQENLYNEQLKKTEGLEREVDEMKRDNETFAQEVARLQKELKDSESDKETLNARIAELEEEAKEWHLKHDSLKELTDNEKADLQKRIEELEQEKKNIQEELDELKKKYEEMMKGGDHADSHTKKYIAKLEAELAETKKGHDKYK
jgi:hypothetical protein